MAREQSPERQRAFQIYKDSGGKIANREIANIMAISEKSVSGWKCKDKWTEKLTGVPKKKERSTPEVLRSTPNNSKGKGGAPKGNKNALGHGPPLGSQNALGNRGGDGAPLGNDRAATHGLFRSFMPQDDETQQIMDMVEQMSPVDMIWQNIVIKYTAIIRAQKIMFVVDQKDETKSQTKSQDTAFGESAEWEYRYAWDKHAAFLNAQARAMSELRSLIKDFMAMSGRDDERRLKLEQMQANIDRTKAEIGKLGKGGDKLSGLRLEVEYG
ncbi:phage terminase small subunit [Paenibacillus alba]|uniref:Phage terminase small subunit n=1 Tax=Paenibacillus alba TaxID=1197127 RepID=A0ABU6GBF8_9BACL|nr:phage terminase small subunit [Paenibacillus alba]MEC0231300.1 phage terminase small subunit [Paenibacillus alba]